MTRLRATIAVLLVAIAAGPFVTPVTAERLAARRFTTADGLAGDYVLAAFRDSRGFLWFSTRDGLSRFDGVRFVNYGRADGLSVTTVNHFLETRAGAYWLSTNGGGLCRFNPDGVRIPAGSVIPDGVQPLFEPYRVGDNVATNRVNVSYEDRAGRIWIGTDDGLFVLDDQQRTTIARRVDLPTPSPDVNFRSVNAIMEDGAGSLWIGGGSGLTRRLPSGVFLPYRFQPASVRDVVDVIAVDREGRIWAGYRGGLLALNPAPAASLSATSGSTVRTIERLRSPTLATAGRNHEETAVWYSTVNGLADDSASALFFSRDGHLWVGTSRGLSEFDGRAFRTRDATNGLSDSPITDMTTDDAGNLWIASVTGVTRLLQNGLVTYDSMDGLPKNRVQSFTQDASGRLLVVDNDFVISHLNGTRFSSFRPELPSDAGCQWLSRCGYRDHAGGWWIPSPTGLYRWDPISRIEDFAGRPARAIYSRGHGLPDDSVLSVFEDARHDVWVGTTPGALLRWERATGTWREYTEADGLPRAQARPSSVVAFVEDRQGTLWLAFEQGGVARLRQGRFEAFITGAGLPVGSLTSLHVDAAGRLWIGSSLSGVVRLDDPAADRPVFTTMSTAHGLASDNIRCFTEDAQGHVYVGTSRGIDRIDPVSRSIKHFSVGEGLASDFVTTAFRDRDGQLWFGTMLGLSRFDPSLEVASPIAATPPPVFISSLRVAGVGERVSELGDAAPPPLTLGPDRNQLEIAFFGFSFDSGEPLKYQYRLEGTPGDWSAASPLTSVNYARLAAGSYRFLVRGVRADGMTSATPAVVAFTVLPPFYARWWFVSLAMLAAGVVGLTLYRARVAQLVGLERVRARIATDLHDDIGSSLSQIAILAEVARERIAHQSDDLGTSEPLNRIAETSRGLVDSMSDIVWAINPEVDALSDLVHRMRRFVEDSLGATDVDVVFRAEEPAHDVKLGADLRREVYLILKESITNIVKHAEAAHVEIDFQADKRRLFLRVTDDGRGFDPNDRTDGNGVASMRRRVAALGGKLTITSIPGRGTMIDLDIDRRRL